LSASGSTFIWPKEPLQLGKQVELNDRRAILVN
jgi:hypothetical protein